MPDADSAQPVQAGGQSLASIAIATAPWNKAASSKEAGKGRDKGWHGSNKGRAKGSGKGAGKGKGGGRHVEATDVQTPWAGNGKGGGWHVEAADDAQTPWAGEGSASASSAGDAPPGIAASSSLGLAADGSQLFMRRDGSVVSGREMQERVET